MLNACVLLIGICSSACDNGGSAVLSTTLTTCTVQCHILWTSLSFKITAQGVIALSGRPLKSHVCSIGKGRHRWSECTSTISCWPQMHILLHSSPSSTPPSHFRYLLLMLHHSHRSICQCIIRTGHTAFQSKILALSQYSVMCHSLWPIGTNVPIKMKAPPILQTRHSRQYHGRWYGPRMQRYQLQRRILFFSPCLQILPHLKL